MIMGMRAMADEEEGEREKKNMRNDADETSVNPNHSLSLFSPEGGNMMHSGIPGRRRGYET